MLVLNFFNQISYKNNDSEDAELSDGAALTYGSELNPRLWLPASTNPGRQWKGLIYIDTCHPMRKLD